MMNKKLFISTLILWIANIFVYYLFCYPESYSLFDIITQHVEWEPLLSIYLILIATTAFFSFLLYRKVNFSRKFITSIIYINIFATILNLSNGFYRFYNNKKELDELVLRYQNDAKTDIKKDSVKSFSHGLMLPPKNENDFNKYIKSDSIHKKYGLYKSSTCNISKDLDIAEKEYQKITNPYLEKRNGKFWREKMQKEIDAIKNNQ
ncbi:hypothetical protein [Flavobacterium sp. 5]|uniref:FEKKY domain-containing protein n=1 Tax=Flavobacterium sp. 5 TaxID=2035199 RepID=UPI000C2B5A52|nr:hypothetical protein [Flavobacterium sp. 5]PKB18225.1 hypothetical protein CLU82_3490 [Flavobacterium sp. 5]